MGAFLSLERWSKARVEWDWPYAILVGIIAGLAEGSLYKTGPNIVLAPYWLIMGGGMVVALVGRLGWLEGLLIFLPLCVWLQDMFSNFAQGINPVTAIWYETTKPWSYLGPLVKHPLYVPTWYYLAFMWTAMMDWGFDKWKGSKRS